MRTIDLIHLPLYRSSDPVSGGTEANNMVIGSFVEMEPVMFLAALVEHSSVVEPLRIRPVYAV